MADKVAAERCRQIWCSVVLQAASDILAMPKRYDGAAVARPSTTEQWQAVGWLGSRDFRLVCTLAGLDAGAVEQGLRGRLAQIERGEVTRAELFRAHGGAALHKRVAADG